MSDNTFSFNYNTKSAFWFKMRVFLYSKDLVFFLSKGVFFDNKSVPSGYLKIS